MARRVLGLDFGTTKSAIAVMSIGDDRVPTLFDFGSGQVCARTCLILDRDTQDVTHWGWPAYELTREGVGDKVLNFKRRLGKSDKDNEYCTKFLQRLVEYTKRKFNLEALREEDFATVIGHPANWSEQNTQRLVEIANQVGFPDVRPLPEPIAAMHSLRCQNQEFRFGDCPEQYMVVDFGGGTLDICIVKTDILGRSPHILATDGDPEFGGSDFDDMVMQWVLRQRELDWDKLGPHDQMAMTKQVEKIKETMAANFEAGNQSSNHILELSDGPQNFFATRDEFICRCNNRDFPNKFLAAVDRALEKAGMRTTDIKRVIMTGGSSQWWFVREQLAKRMGLGGPKELVNSITPTTDVACGCAISIGRSDEPPARLACWIRYSFDGNPQLEKVLTPPGGVRASVKDSLFLGTIAGSSWVKVRWVGLEFLYGETRDKAATSSAPCRLGMRLRSNHPMAATARDVIDVIRRQEVKPKKDEYRVFLHYESKQPEGLRYFLEVLDNRDVSTTRPVFEGTTGKETLFRRKVVWEDDDAARSKGTSPQTTSSARASEQGQKEATK